MFHMFSMDAMLDPFNVCGPLFVFVNCFNHGFTYCGPSERFAITLNVHQFFCHTFCFINLVQFLQTNVMYYRGIGHALQTICRDEGVLGLYKGLGATLLVTFYCIVLFFMLIWILFSLVVDWDFPLMQGVGPSIAISFSVYETLRSYWQLQRWLVHIWFSNFVVSECNFYVNCFRHPIFKS